MDDIPDFDGNANQFDDMIIDLANSSNAIQINQASSMSTTDLRRILNETQDPITFDDFVMPDDMNRLRTNISTILRNRTFSIQSPEQPSESIMDNEMSIQDQFLELANSSHETELALLEDIPIDRLRELLEFSQNISPEFINAQSLRPVDILGLRDDIKYFITLDVLIGYMHNTSPEERATFSITTQIRYYNDAKRLLRMNLNISNPFELGRIIVTLRAELISLNDQINIEQHLSEIQRISRDRRLLSDIVPVSLRELAIYTEYIINILDDNTHPFFSVITRNMNDDEIDELTENLSDFLNEINQLLDNIPTGLSPAQPAIVASDDLDARLAALRAQTSAMVASNQAHIQELQSTEQSNIPRIVRDWDYLAHFAIYVSGNALTRFGINAPILAIIELYTIASYISEQIANNDIDRDLVAHVPDLLVDKFAFINTVTPKLLVDITRRQTDTDRQNILIELRSYMNNNRSLDDLSESAMHELFVKTEEIIDILYATDTDSGIGLFFNALFGDLDEDQVERTTLGLESLQADILLRQMNRPIYIMSTSEIDEKYGNNRPEILKEWDNIVTYINDISIATRAMLLRSLPIHGIMDMYNTYTHILDAIAQNNPILTDNIQREYLAVIQELSNQLLDILTTRQTDAERLAILNSLLDKNIANFSDDELHRMDIQAKYLLYILQHNDHPFFRGLWPHENVPEWWIDELTRLVSDIYSHFNSANPQAIVTETSEMQLERYNEIIRIITEAGDIDRLKELIQHDKSSSSRWEYVRVALDERRFEYVIALFSDDFIAHIQTNNVYKQPKNQMYLRLMAGYIHAMAFGYAPEGEIRQTLNRIFWTLASLNETRSKPDKKYPVNNVIDETYTYQSNPNQEPPKPRFLTNKSDTPTWRWHYFLWVRTDNAFDNTTIQDTPITPSNFEQHIPPYERFSQQSYEKWKIGEPLDVDKSHHPVIGWTKQQIAYAIADSGLIPYQAYEHQIERVKPSENYFKSASRDPHLQEALTTLRIDMAEGKAPRSGETDIYLPHLLAMNARYERQIVFGFTQKLRDNGYDTNAQEIAQIIEDLETLYNVRLAKARNKYTFNRTDQFRKLTYIQYINKFVTNPAIRSLFFYHYNVYRQKIIADVAPYRELGMQQYVPPAPKYYYIFIYRRIFETVNINTQLAIFTKYDRRKPFSGQYYATEAIGSDEYYCEFNDPAYGRKELLDTAHKYFGMNAANMRMLASKSKPVICQILLRMKLGWIRRFYRRVAAINKIITSKMLDINQKYNMQIKLFQMPGFIRILKLADKGLIKYSMPQWIQFERALIITVNQIYKALNMLDGIVGKVIQFAAIEKGRYIYYKPPNEHTHKEFVAAMRKPFPKGVDFLGGIIKKGFEKIIRVTPIDTSTNFQNIINHADMFRTQIYAGIEYMYGELLDALRGFCAKRFTTNSELPYVWGMDVDDQEDWNKFLNPYDLLISPLGDCWDAESYINSIKDAAGSNMTRISSDKTIEMWPDYWSKQKLIEYGQQLQTHPSGLGKDMSAWFTNNIPDIDWKSIEADPPKFIPREFMDLLREVGSVLWLRGPVFNTLLQKELSPELLAEWNSKLKGMSTWERPIDLSPALADTLIRIQEEYRYKFAEYYYNDEIITSQLRQAIGIFIHKKFGMTSFRAETIYRCFREGTECVMMMGDNMFTIYNHLAPYYGLAPIPTNEQEIVAAVPTDPAIVADPNAEPAPVIEQNIDPEAITLLNNAIDDDMYRTFMSYTLKYSPLPPLYERLIENNRCAMLRWMFNHHLYETTRTQSLIIAALNRGEFWMIKYMLHMGYWNTIIDFRRNISSILTSLSNANLNGAFQFICENFLSDLPANEVRGLMTAALVTNWSETNDYLTVFSAYLNDPTLRPVNGPIANDIRNNQEVALDSFDTCTRADMWDIFDAIIEALGSSEDLNDPNDNALANLQTIFQHVQSTYLDISFMLNYIYSGELPLTEPSMYNILLANDYIWRDDLDEALYQANDAIIQESFTLLPDQFSTTVDWHMPIFINAIYNRNSIPILKGFVARGAHQYLIQNITINDIVNITGEIASNIPSSNLIHLAFERNYTRSAKYLLRVLTQYYPDQLADQLTHILNVRPVNVTAVIMILENYPEYRTDAISTMLRGLSVRAFDVYLNNLTTNDTISLSDGDMYLQNSAPAPVYNYLYGVAGDALLRLLRQLPLRRIHGYMQWLLFVINAARDDDNRIPKIMNIIVNYIKDMYMDYTDISHDEAIYDYVAERLFISFIDDTLDRDTTNFNDNIRAFFIARNVQQEDANEMELESDENVQIFEEAWDDDNDWDNEVLNYEE